MKPAQEQTDYGTETDSAKDERARNWDREPGDDHEADDGIDLARGLQMRCVFGRGGGIDLPQGSLQRAFATLGVCTSRESKVCRIDASTPMLRSHSVGAAQAEVWRSPTS